MHEIADLITQKTDPQQIFELLDILGQGSYGSVFKALHKQTGELYAIKILPATSGIQISAIKKQIGVLKQCDDDHIVRYYGSYYKDGNLWIIMEYCVAGSVTDIMQITKKKLNQEEIASIIQSALKGLNYIHSNKKIHRDIKAANVLLDQKGYAKLADFGVSASSIYTNDRFKTHIGSPYWMSPQIIRYTQYNHKTDIWSLGITAIQLAQGQVPNSHIKPFMVIFMTKSNPVQGFSNPNLWSSQLNDFVKQCLNINPQNRPQAKQLLEHDFIKKKSKGQRLLQELVLSSLQQIQQFRMNQSRNSSFAQIIVDQGKADTKTIVQKSRDLKNQTNSNQSNSQDIYQEGGSMVILSSHRSNSDTGSMVINSSMLINDKEDKNQNKNMLSQYIKQLKDFSNTQNQYEIIKQRFIQQINQIDKACQNQLLSVFNKYKQMYRQKMKSLSNIYNQNIEQKDINQVCKCQLGECSQLRQFINCFLYGKASLDKTSKYANSHNNSIISHKNSLKQNKIIEQIEFYRKQSESFKHLNNKNFQKKTYIQKDIATSNQMQQKTYPSHQSSRILFKNPQNETPSSIPKKIQQFKQDPDVLEYLQKTFGAVPKAYPLPKSKQKIGKNNEKQANYLGVKMKTQVCVKQQKSTEHSVSKGKNIRSNKNIKPKKSKNKGK